VLENGVLEEFYIERLDARKQFGNIYKGIVRKVVPGMGAAFIDIGTGKDGFIYVNDLLGTPSEEFEERMDDEHDDEEEDERRFENVNIQNIVKEGQELIVQIVKEPIRNKGARLTTHLSIPGRYLVWMPGEGHVGISRRIYDRDERQRLKKIFSEIDLPKDAGVIVRTAGEGKSKKDFVRDVKYLASIWDAIRKNKKQKEAPSLIHEELDLVQRLIRDSFTEDTDKIVVDNREYHKEVQRFFKLYLPDYRANLELYQSRTPLFDRYKIERDIESMFQKKVYIKSGGHIVIEQTESLVSIDVNTGKFTGKRNLEETVYQTNCEAADEISRQLRLRDMGGIIIVDFIDMVREEHKRNLYRIFKEAVKKDRAKTNILRISEIGLVEMTRQRVRPPLGTSLYTNCPYCEGKGVVRSVSTMVIQIFREIRRYISRHKTDKVFVDAHPLIVDRLLKEDRRALGDLEKNVNVKVIPLKNGNLHIEEFKIASE
jgi:ribonuclease G